MLPASRPEYRKFAPNQRGTAEIVALVNTGPSGASVGLFGFVLMFVRSELLQAAAARTPTATRAIFDVRMCMSLRAAITA